MRISKLKKSRYGLLSDGTKIHLFTISNGKMSVSVTNYGAILTSILLPAKGGGDVDVLLGFSTLDGFIRDDCSFGATVGRFANRIGGASFTLDGVKYDLDKNDNGENMLHGGFDRWEKKVWKAKKVKTENGIGVKFTHISPDGEQKFPGTVKASVTYTLSEDNALTIEYEAETDKPTPINLTNHAYFNLKGYAGGSIEDQELQMFCSKYVEPSDKLIPTGKLIDVEGTPYDFKKPHFIGRDIAKTGMGYDHCYCIDGFTPEKKLNLAAIVKDPASGRKMVVKTTEPGVQLYTANFLNNVHGKNGFVYQKHGALCLEAEAYPDSPNKSEFPSCIVRPGEKYRQVTQYAFEF